MTLWRPSKSLPIRESDPSPMILDKPYAVKAAPARQRIPKTSIVMAPHRSALQLRIPDTGSGPTLGGFVGNLMRFRSRKSQNQEEPR